MATTLNSSGVLFPDGTTQTTAAAAGRSGITNTTTGSNITLTSSSNQVQNIKFTSTGLYVTLPNATTLAGGDAIFIIRNTGNYPVEVRNAAGNVLCVVLDSVTIGLLENSTSAGIWSADGLKLAFSPVGISATANNAAIGTLGTESICLLTASSGVVLYTNSTLLVLRAFTISAGVFTFGTAVTLTSSSGGWYGYRNLLVRLTDTSGVVTCGNPATADVYAWAFTLSGTTLTVGSRTSLDSANALNMYSAFVRFDNTRFIYAGYTPTAYTVRVRACSVSGTTITAGTAVTYNFTSVSGGSGSTAPFIGVTYNGTGVVISGTGVAAVPFTLSGTTITFGTSYTLPFSQTLSSSSNANSNVYSDSTEPNRVYISGIIVDCSGNSVTAATMSQSEAPQQAVMYRASSGNVCYFAQTFWTNKYTSLPVAADTRYQTTQYGLSTSGAVNTSGVVDSNGGWYVSRYRRELGDMPYIAIYGGTMVRIISKGENTYGSGDFQIETTSVIG